MILVKNNLYPTGFGLTSAVLIKLALRFPLGLVVYGPCTDSDIRMSGKKESERSKQTLKRGGERGE